MRSRSNLFSYQQDAVDFLLTDDARQLIAIMGAGKTTIAEHAVADLKEAGELDAPGLVVAPLMIAETVWAAEAKLWEDTAGLKIELVLGTPKQRRAMLDRPADLYVINYDNLKWLAEEVIKRRITFSVLIADESSKIKNPFAQRTKMVLALGGIAKRRWTLTGTPRGHQLTDVWAPAQFVTRETAFPPFYAWRAANFFTNDLYERNWFPRHGVEAAITARLRAFTHVVDHAALNTRPPVIEIVHDVPIDGATDAIYQKIDNGMTRSIALEAGARPISIHEMAVVGKLTQVLSGAIYDDSGAWQRLHDPRLDILAEIHDAHDRPTMVFVNFRHEIERICQRFSSAKELTAERIDAWNAGDIELLVAHPASAGHGVNLQYGSDTLVWFSLPWSAELYAQANARVARQGQRNTVNVHVFLTRGCIDEIAYQLVHQRLQDQERLIEALQN
jgi:SNF2 family DNA or RNA helicase